MASVVGLHGCDPRCLPAFSEFMVEEHELRKEKIQEDYNDRYWDQRYTVVQRQIPSFLQKMAGKVLSTGDAWGEGGGTAGLKRGPSSRTCRVSSVIVSWGWVGWAGRRWAVQAVSDSCGLIDCICSLSLRGCLNRCLSFLTAIALLELCCY